MLERTAVNLPRHLAHVRRAYCERWPKASQRQGDQGCFGCWSLAFEHARAVSIGSSPRPCACQADGYIAANNLLVRCGKRMLNCAFAESVDGPSAAT